MDDTHPRRILIVTDAADPTPELVDAIRHSHETRPTQFRVVVPNPARAELHLLHPERHDRAPRPSRPAPRPPARTGRRGPVIGSVSVRHDPMDAVEEVLFSRADRRDHARTWPRTGSRTGCTRTSRTACSTSGCRSRSCPTRQSRPGARCPDRISRTARDGCAVRSQRRV